jgi:hypothetical protein
MRLIFLIGFELRGAIFHFADAVFMRLKVLFVASTLFDERFSRSSCFLQHPLGVAERSLVLFKPFWYFSPQLFEFDDSEIDFLQFDEGGEL